MKALLTSLFLALAIVNEVAAAPNTMAGESQIHAALDDMYQAANSHDTDRFMQWYAHESSLVITFDGNTMRGWQPIRDQQLQWWENGKSKAEYREDGPSEITLLSPDVATTVQMLSVGAPTIGQSTKHARLVITSVWKKRPEGWRIVLAHESLVGLK